jgi:hypothetical protein
MKAIGLTITDTENPLNDIITVTATSAISPLAKLMVKESTHGLTVRCTMVSGKMVSSMDTVSGVV